HLLYILNNPLSGTDPTGYATQGSVCDVGEEGNNANGCASCNIAQLQNSQKQTRDKKNAANGGSGNGAANGSQSSQGTTGSAGRKNQAASPEKKNDARSNGDKIGDVLGGILEGLLNNLAYSVWDDNYADYNTGCIGGGCGDVSPRAQGLPLSLPYPNQPDTLEGS
ncbi:hypothetical protein QT970_29865, partial [Microcoleus sp. herbarium8]|uniref:hypothetical protein n=1 Tax=Microcoleus sp. herbarium8 TaxID=3055436 RepID=UPI002FD58C2A